MNAALRDGMAVYAALLTADGKWEIATGWRASTRAAELLWRTAPGKSGIEYRHLKLGIERAFATGAEAAVYVAAQRAEAVRKPGAPAAGKGEAK